MLKEDWSDGILNRAPTDRTVRDICKELYRILSSGEVTVQIDDGGDPHILAAHETNRLSFRINPAKNCIELRDPADRWNCRLNQHELDRFLAKYASIRFSEEPMGHRRDRCLKWLIEKMQKPKEGSKAAYRRQAVKEFGVTARAFDSLWAHAIEVTGSNWAQSGRPKSNH
jgi:hypothetical protein